MDDKERNDTYKIYNYLKKEPAVVISIISGFIAVVTGLLNFSATSIQKQYFEYWNIPIYFAEYDTTNIIYQLCVVATLCFCSILSMLFINSFFAKFFQDESFHIQEKLARKECLKHLNKIRGKCAIAYLLCFVLGVTRRVQSFSGWYKLLNKSKNLLKETKTSVESCRQKVNRFQKIPLSRYPLARIKLILKLFVLSFFVFVINLLLGSSFFDKGIFEIFAGFITALIIVPYSVSGYLIARKKLKKKEIKENVRAYLGGKREWKYVEYKNIYVKDSLKEYFTDKQIKGHLLAFMILISFVFTLLLVGMSHTITQQKGFHVLEKDGESYVVLHRCDDNLILEKAVFVGDDIIIYTHKQTIIQDDDVDLHYIYFDRVFRKV